MRHVLRAAALLGFAWSGSAAHAEVTQMQIADRQAYGSFRAGDYVRL